MPIAEGSVGQLRFFEGISAPASSLADGCILAGCCEKA
jgi:hypothetical protein